MKIWNEDEMNEKNPFQRSKSSILYPQLKRLSSSSQDNNCVTVRPSSHLHAKTHTKDFHINMSTMVHISILTHPKFRQGEGVLSELSDHPFALLEIWGNPIQPSTTPKTPRILACTPISFLPKAENGHCEVAV